MVPCTCWDDTKRPSQIPEEKWIKKDEKYRVLGLYVHLNHGNIQGVTLMEKPLDESCAPYQTFKLSRFAFKQEDLPKLIQLAKDCSDIQKMNDADMAQLEKLIKEELELV